MLFIKSADKKFSEIGFLKIYEGKYGAEYQRYDEKHNFYHIIYIAHKKDGRHIVQSYDRDAFDQNLTGNIGVGLTMYEMELCLKKMKELGWKKDK